MSYVGVGLTPQESILNVRLMEAQRKLAASGQSVATPSRIRAEKRATTAAQQKLQAGRKVLDLTPPEAVEPQKAGILGFKLFGIPVVFLAAAVAGGYYLWSKRKKTASSPSPLKKEEKPL
jgi:hypothetical protein